MIYIISICLSNAILLLPIAANSDTVSRPEIRITDTTDKASGAAYETASDSFAPAREQYLPYNSRLPDNQSIKNNTSEKEPEDLTIFFTIGVAINIIMALTFAWWFSKEWRKSKK